MVTTGRRHRPQQLPGLSARYLQFERLPFAISAHLRNNLRAHLADSRQHLPLLRPRAHTADTLPWLGSWLGLLLDERWPDEKRRDLILAAADLYRWRGTRRGLEQFIRVYTGITPEIKEPTLSEISTSRDLAYRFTVRLVLPAGSDVDRDLLEQIIDLEKPAFAAGSLEIVRERSRRALRPLLG